MKKSGWSTFLYFLRMYPRKSILMVGALSAAGLLEGVGLAALLPLIITVMGDMTGIERPGQQTDAFHPPVMGAEAEGTGLAMAVESLFSALGLEISIANTLIFIIVVMIGKAMLSFIAVRQVAYTSSHVTALLRRDYVRALLGANWLHYVGLQSGATANALGREAERSSLSFRQGCQALSYIIQIGVYGALACLISWRLTAAAFLAGGLLAALLGFFIRETRAAGRELTAINNRVLALITDTLFGAKPLKAMNKGLHLFRMVESDIIGLQTAQRKLDLYDQALGILAEPIMVVMVGVGLFGALTYTDIPIPQLLFMAVVFLRMVMRIATAQRSYQAMVANESAMWTLRDKISAAQENQEVYGSALPPALGREIKLDEVNFSYGEKRIFRSLSLVIPARQFTLFLGPSGAGKTTLIDLIAGLHEPQSGRVLIDGADLADMDKAGWRSRIGYVPQDVLLFHDTIYHNIALNDDALTRADVEDALAKAGALDFVQAQENGLDTVVGERGARLSGGQRQRIAIARALVHKPQLLILDEATSALDAATEKQILETVRSLSHDVTVIAISHNPALAEVADTIYEMAAGIVQQRHAAA